MVNENFIVVRGILVCSFEGVTTATVDLVWVLLVWLFTAGLEVALDTLAVLASSVLVCPSWRF